MSTSLPKRKIVEVHPRDGIEQPNYNDRRALWKLYWGADTEKEREHWLYIIQGEPRI